MPRLSLPIENIKDHYSVVVVGSGYGGGIAASRMARAGQRVCVLEQGKEFQPGEYPNTETGALAEMQIRTAEGTVGSPTGLYEFVVGEGINVFKGCGLGGTSLVNANVSLQAEPRVFEDPRWPAQVRADLATLVQQGYDRAREMLKPTPYPDTFPGASQDGRAGEIGAIPGTEVLPDAHQCDVRGQDQPRGRTAEHLHHVRRLRDRLQLRRQEHHPDELSARRPELRRGDLHRGFGAIPRTARRQVGGALPGARRRPRGFQGPRHVRNRRYRHAGRGHASVRRRFCCGRRRRGCRSPAWWASASRATATCWVSATTGTRR